jgi:putative transposase
VSLCWFWFTPLPRWRIFNHGLCTPFGGRPHTPPPIEAAAHRELRAIADRCGILVHAIGGIEDHLHLVVSIPPKLSVADAVQRLKGSSSHALRAEFGDVIKWQTEYSVDSFSERHLPTVIAYVENQRQHHQNRTLIPSIEPD